MEHETEEEVVTAVAMSPAEFNGIFIKLFGVKAGIQMEGFIFDVARIYTCQNDLSYGDGPKYSGGSWQFMRLSNGGFFMFPSITIPEGSRPDGKIRCRWPDNDSDVRLTPEALGLAATSMAMSNLSFNTTGAVQQAICDHFTWLSDYRYCHPEFEAISRLLD